MTDTLYRKVYCKDRLPENDIPVIGVFEDSQVAKVSISHSGYWYLFDNMTNCEIPYYWLEPIPELNEILKTALEGLRELQEFQDGWENDLQILEEFLNQMK